MGHEAMGGGAVRVLLESGVDVDEVTTEDGSTARFMLSLRVKVTGAWLSMQLLSNKAGADVNKATPDRSLGALRFTNYFAAQEGHAMA